MNDQRIQNVPVVWCVFVIVVLCVRSTAGQQQNCIDASDTTITTVVTPAVLKLGGTTVVQCQVSPPGKHLCGFRITMSGQSGQFAFDETNCPRGTITESRYTGQCDVTAGRYGLRITNVRMTDSGMWKCDYMNSFPNSNAIITVIAPPSGPVLTSEPTAAIDNIVKVQENSQLTITCDSSQSGATGLTYKWSGANLSGQSNNKLSFTRISRTDSGVYTCNVSNIAGSVAGSIAINVLYPPGNVKLQGPTSPVQVSATVILTCTATGGNPKPNLAITRTPEGSTVKQGINPLTYSTSVTKADNQAEYQCTATGAGIPTPMISNKVRLTVNFQATTLKMVKKPADYVLVNHNQQIECKTDSSNPAVQIQWFTYSSTTWTPLVSQPATNQTTGTNHGFVTTSILSITATKTMNQAQYRCQTGSIYKDTTITVHYPPSSVALQGPTSPVRDSISVDFTCTATGGNPVPNLTITTGGSTVKQGVSPLTYSTSVTKTDNQAEYQCAASGAGISTPMISNKFILTVNFQATSLTMVKKPADHVLFNNNQQMECTTDSSNPAVQIQWFKYSSTTWTLLDSQQATNQTSAAYHGFMATSTLSMTATKSMNQAQYRCQTGNLSNDATITVHFPPESMTLTEIPNGPVVQGTSKTLTCTTDSSNPVSTIVWANSSGTTTWTNLSPNPAVNHKPGSHSGQISTSSLVVSTDKDKNGRQYRCTAYQNSYPVNGVTNSTTLSVLFPPESITLTEIPNGPVVHGTSKTLTCTTDSSNPVSTIVWAYSSGTTTWTDISPNPTVNHKPGSHSARASTSSLVVPTDKDKNGRQYRCSAYQNSQPVNGVNTSMTLSILYAPQLSSQVEPVAANIGESGRFTINFDANPLATTLNCRHNSTKGRHVMKNTSLTQWDVNIQSVQASDYGSYSCRLNNSVGSIDITLKLTETGPPQTPSNLSVIAKTAVSVTLSWVSEFEGGAKQTFAVSYRVSDATQFVNKAEIPDPGYRKLVQTKITGLKPSTDYQFKVKSVNLNPGDNTSPFTDIVTTRTNAIPSAINTVLKQATVTQYGNSVLIKMSSFPSKYSVYVKYCIKHTNECFNSTKQESTGGPISIEIKIDPDKAYSYKLIVIESSDVILSHRVEIPVTTNVALIGGVVVGVLLLALIVIVFVLLFVKRRREGQWIWTKNSSRSPASVPPPNYNDIDGHVAGPRGDVYARVNKKPKSPPTKDNHVTTDDFDPYSNIDDLVSEDGVKKTGEPIYAQVDKKKKRNQNQVVNGASGTDPIYSNVDKSKKKKTKVVNGASGTDPIYSNVDKSKKKKTKGSVDSAEPLYSQVDKNKKRKGKKAKKAEKNENYEMENPYQTVGDEANPYQDVYNDDDGDIVKYVNCGVDNPAFNADDVEELRKEPIYLHVVNNVKNQAPPGVLIGDFEDFSTYSELGRVVEPQVQAELVARLEAEEAERRRQREEEEQQKKSC
ncbi:nephrin-like isoform X1 [Tubulanus polymorphus]|uniref:nephrin-like isoform X1 n=1 Tax=Tubulanus polymorphus TaxID=672921 RepID=UPI003DA3343B